MQTRGRCSSYLMHQQGCKLARVLVARFRAHSHRLGPRWFASRRLRSLVILFSITFFHGAAFCHSQACTEPQSNSGDYSLMVEPTRIELSGSNRQQFVLVTAQYSDGSSRDVTKECTFSVADGAVARMGD